jgi:hypothetical protein
MDTTTMDTTTMETETMNLRNSIFGSASVRDPRRRFTHNDQEHVITGQAITTADR